MINTKKLRQAIKTADIAQIKEILLEIPKAQIRFACDWTPLHVAAKRGNKDVVGTIIETGADVNATTEIHQTPLDLALKHNHKSVADLLRKNGARVGAELFLHPAVAAGDFKAVRKHVRAGAHIDQLVNDARPLCIALEYRHWDVAKFLLNKKCDVTKPQKWDVTPLHIAAGSGAPEELRAALLKRGALVDAIDNGGRTPLCRAAEAGHLEIADWLLDHGANVTRGHEHSSTPVYCALYRRHVELASHLIDRGCKSTLHQAIQCNHLVRARQKLNAGADVNHEKDTHRLESTMEMAIFLDSADMVSLLLEFGADPNLDRAGGNTSLHAAVHKGSAKMVKLLLAHGADPEMANTGGTTPIELARQKDRIYLANMMEAHLDKKLSLDATQTGIEPLYTVQKVAQLLSVDDTFILELINTRKITGLHLDKKTLRITGGSIQRYLAKVAR